MGLASIKFLENIELARNKRNNRGAYEGVCRQRVKLVLSRPCEAVVEESVESWGSEAVSLIYGWV
jgi:hypothetical protein